MLEIKDVKKKFNDEVVLDGVDLTINQGEVIHIKGGNGSGKSTLLKIIAQLMTPDFGEVRFCDEVNLGALIENPSFIENEDVAFNLEFLGNLKGSFHKDRAVELLARFSLDYANKKKLRKYSVGMRQKVGIVQAIMEDQNVLLFDEPTRGLDDKSVVQFAKLISELKDEGKAILICAHDGVDLVEFTDRFTLNDGKLYQIS